MDPNVHPGASGAPVGKKEEEEKERVATIAEMLEDSIFPEGDITVDEGDDEQEDEA